MVGASDACYSRNEDGDNLYLAALFHHKITEEVCRVGSAETSDKEPKELEARQPRQLRSVIEVGYEGCAGGKQQIERCTDTDTEPEHSVIIFVLHRFLVDNGKNEATFLEDSGHGGKDSQHSHHTVIGTVQQAG